MGTGDATGFLRNGVGHIVDSPSMYRLSQVLSDPWRLGPMRAALARVPHSSLLDLGCGVGDLAGVTDARYTGVDISPAYVAYAQRHFGGPNRRFVVGDALVPDPGLGQHDVVALISFLHHLADDEARRCLKGLEMVSPSRLFIIESALERAGAVFRRVFAPLDRGKHYRTTAGIAELLKGAGWEIEREHPFGTPLGFFPYVAIVAGRPGRV